jgi:uncharacterized protein YndB with AHSA1/START domain
MDKVKVTKDVENKTLTIEQTFDAPKEKLWHAYTDKNEFEKWWGPEGWQTTTKEFDFRPGGQIHYGMKCVDKDQGEWFGKESWGLTHIESVDDLHSFTAKDYFADADGTVDPEMPPQKFVVEFIEEDGKTHLINRSIVETAEQLEQLIQMGMVEGFSSQLQKLDELVTS